MDSKCWNWAINIFRPFARAVWTYNGQHLAVVNGQVIECESRKVPTFHQQVLEFDQYLHQRALRCWIQVSAQLTRKVMVSNRIPSAMAKLKLPFPVSSTMAVVNTRVW